jgi:hypothetical protein
MLHACELKHTQRCEPFMTVFSFPWRMHLTWTAQRRTSRSPFSGLSCSCGNFSAHLDHHISRCNASLRLYDHCARYRCVASFTPLTLYPRGKGPGPHWIGGWGAVDVVWISLIREYLLPLPRIESNHPVHNLISIPTEISQLWGEQMCTKQCASHGNILFKN